MDWKELKKFIESSAGKPMKEYLEMRLKSMLSIEALQNLNDPVEMTIEVKAQAKAYYKLRSILDDIMLIENEKVVEEKKEEDSLIPGV